MKMIKKILAALATAFLMVSLSVQANQAKTISVKPEFPVMKNMKDCVISRAFIYGDRLFLFSGYYPNGEEKWFDALPSTINPRVWVIDDHLIDYTATEIKNNVLNFHVQGLSFETHCNVRNLQMK